MKNSFLRKLGALVKLIGVVVFAIGIHPPMIGAEYAPPEPDDYDKREILLLARTIFSESNKDREAQEYVACVVLNRVNTGYSGNTIEEVVFAKNQFSGLQPSDPRYKLNMSLGYEDVDSAHPGWASALEVASEVYNSNGSDCPFSETVRHFYSPNAVGEPHWARGKTPVLVMNSPSFAFYDNVK